MLFRSLTIPAIRIRKENGRDERFSTSDSTVNPLYWLSDNYEQQLIKIIETFPEGIGVSIVINGVAKSFEGILGPIKERKEEQLPPIILVQDLTSDFATSSLYNSTIPNTLFIHGGTITIKE